MILFMDASWIIFLSILGFVNLILFIVIFIKKFSSSEPVPKQSLKLMDKHRNSIVSDDIGRRR